MVLPPGLPRTWSIRIHICWRELTNPQTKTGPENRINQASPAMQMIEHTNIRRILNCLFPGLIDDHSLSCFPKTSPIDKPMIVPARAPTAVTINTDNIVAAMILALSCFWNTAINFLRLLRKTGRNLYRRSFPVADDNRRKISVHLTSLNADRSKTNIRNQQQKRLGVRYNAFSKTCSIANAISLDLLGIVLSQPPKLISNDEGKIA